MLIAYLKDVYRYLCFYDTKFNRNISFDDTKISRNLSFDDFSGGLPGLI